MSEQLSKKPIIGILSDKESKEGIPRYFVKSNYVSATKEAGGIPLIIPPSKDENDLTKTLDLIDGLLIPGGDDIDPKYFKEDLHPSVVLIDPEIIQFQMGFCSKALEKDIPVFGICAGLQIINIVCGGNIYQDIPSQYSNPVRHKKNKNEKVSDKLNVIYDQYKEWVQTIVSENELKQYLESKGYKYKNNKMIGLKLIT